MFVLLGWRIIRESFASSRTAMNISSASNTLSSMTLMLTVCTVPTLENTGSLVSLNFSKSEVAKNKLNFNMTA